MTYVIAEPCIGTKDGSCVEVCPVQAIFPDIEVPPEWSRYIEANRDHFVSEGSPR